MQKFVDSKHLQTNKTVDQALLEAEREEEFLSAIEEPPAYLFDLVQLSIAAHEKEYGLMTRLMEEAKEKGADIKQIRRAVFRGDKKLSQQMNVYIPHFIE